MLNELLRRWRAFLRSLPDNMKPRRLYMAGEELNVIEEYHREQPRWWGICHRIRAGECGVLFYLNGIPVERRQEK